MADFLTTNGTSHHIEDIIIDATSELVLVSPYLQLSKTFFERLKDASNRKVLIKIIYGKDDLRPNEKALIGELKGVELYYFENLHAKCFYNENTMVITSMNMYQFSEKTNREMGILIDALNDKNIYTKATAEVRSIMQSAERKVFNNSFRTPTENITAPKHYQTASVKQGFCIRCESSIAYDPGAPYCLSCYQTWSNFQNHFYEENVCHRCGKDESSTMARPRCYNCYSTSTM
ncbi:phospholipase D-like domain-containing protein [Flavobacterium subsaxonicum]|uniref:phospholipase D-like domain-containing protein n=1 Tax=Flavobacterium subsaxonicum TaxID=426226 RepID=UPI000411BA7D|nr:phospholipase D-like domain-containing protein [Flavobacterium subsaxonicum]